MTGTVRRAGIAATVAAAMLAAGTLAAGCGSAAASPHASTTSVPAAGMNTAVATAAGTWATVVMGGSAAQYNNFWQLFVRPAGSSAWKLVTPPGTADNGGLVVANGVGQSAVTAFLPSQDLTYTPLIQTANDGAAWSALSPFDAALASTPGSLAVQPTGGKQLLALTAAGSAEQAALGSSQWHTLATVRAVAGTPAGRRCGLRALTAVAYTASGAPLLAGECTRPGIAGVFTSADGTWQAVGPVTPVGLSGREFTVLRLTVIGNQTVALLQAGSGRSAELLAAWSGNGSRWTVSAPLQLGGAALASASFGSSGLVAVITADGRAAVISGSGESWRMLPALPAGTATIAPGPAGQADALAVHGSRLTVWQIPASGSAWSKAQVITVPIEYGSSD